MWARFRRRRRLLLVVVIVLTAAGAVTTARLFVWPTTGEATDPDAVVLFVGGRGERLETALDLVRRHEPAALVVPNGTDPTWPAANRLCSEPQAVRVICPTPRPDTTRGEARAIAELAAREGWDRLVLVTSDYHVSRARLLLSRCFDGDLAVVAADSRLGLVQRGTRIAHEWIGYAQAQAFARSC